MRRRAPAPHCPFPRLPVRRRPIRMRVATANGALLPLRVHGVCLGRRISREDHVSGHPQRRGPGRGGCCGGHHPKCGPLCDTDDADSGVAGKAARLQPMCHSPLAAALALFPRPAVSGSLSVPRCSLPLSPPHQSVCLSVCLSSLSVSLCLSLSLTHTHPSLPPSFSSRSSSQASLVWTRSRGCGTSLGTRRRARRSSCRPRRRIATSTVPPTRST